MTEQEKLAAAVGGMTEAMSAIAAEKDDWKRERSQYEALREAQIRDCDSAVLARADAKAFNDRGAQIREEQHALWMTDTPLSTS